MTQAWFFNRVLIHFLVSGDGTKGLLEKLQTDQRGPSCVCLHSSLCVCVCVCVEGKAKNKEGDTEGGSA